MLLLALLAGISDVVARLETGAWSGRYFALFAALALISAAFVALTEANIVDWLRQCSAQSAAAALTIPLLLIFPYLVYGWGTETFSAWTLLKLVTYILAPNLLLLPDRLRPRAGIGWRDAAAMLALAAPVSAGWLAHIWTYPLEFGFFRAAYCVSTGVYAFVVIRRLDNVGSSLLWSKQDLAAGIVRFAGFAALGIPLGYALRFIRLRSNAVRPEVVAIEFVGIYLTIAIPEEVLFRGILQNLIEQSFSSNHRSLHALLLASPVFGLCHLYHRPAPNWRYALMATLAGLFYGNAFLRRRRTACCALTHALVDTVWSAWL
ncbi:MAG: CPBP family intramembrane glutamic endopeptidase [Terriglobia bacterium]